MGKSYFRTDATSGIGVRKIKNLTYSISLRTLVTHTTRSQHTQLIETLADIERKIKENYFAPSKLKGNRGRRHDREERRRPTGATLFCFSRPNSKKKSRANYEICFNHGRT